MTTQERAYTSPIWYTPADRSVRRQPRCRNEEAAARAAAALPAARRRTVRAPGWIGGRNAAQDEIVISQGQVEHLAAGSRACTSGRRCGRTRRADRRSDPRGDLLSRGVGAGAGPGRHHRAPPADAEARVRVARTWAGAGADRCAAAGVPAAHPDSSARAALQPEQVYLNPQRHGARLDRGASVARGTAAPGEAMRAARGDPSCWSSASSGAEGEATRLFGNEFETALATLPVGTWRDR